MSEQEKPQNDKTVQFANYRARLRALQKNRAPLNERSYSRWGYRANERVGDDFTIDEILNIVRSGDPVALRQLSRYYYRTNGIYRNNIDFLASLPLYDNIVIPVYEEGKGSETQIMKQFQAACKFVDAMSLPDTLNHITTMQLLDGVYYGILREDAASHVTVQDLPIDYCRNRFKDLYGLDILEFNLQYFEKITDEEARMEAINSFPQIIQSAQRKRIKDPSLIPSPWVSLPASVGGISFSFANDQTPLLIASIPELKKLDDAIKREEKRDENELYKLLIQRMPVDSKGELVFQLPEVADIHASVADMLSDMDTIDVLTTFGDTSLESVQDSTSATQSTDRIEKYKNNGQDALGRGEMLFNPTNSSALEQTLKKDESIMNAYLHKYEVQIRYLVNTRFAKSYLTFDFSILPTNTFNRETLQSTYFRGAQYGYSKIFAGVAMGIPQRDQLSLVNFENDFLHMSERMVPLQSSYTTSGTAVAGEDKNPLPAASKDPRTIQVAKDDSNSTPQVSNDDGDGGEKEDGQANTASV